MSKYRKILAESVNVTYSNRGQISIIWHFKNKQTKDGPILIVEEM